MTIQRRGPRRSISPFGDLTDWFQEDPWQVFDRWRQQEMPTAPSIDVRETDDAYVVKAEMPGVKPDEAEVTLDGRTLVIRGRYGEEREDEQEGRWIVRERRSGTYARAITLPSGVDPEKIKASFENGELMLTVPKAQENRARRIPIGGGAAGAKSVGSGDGRTAARGEQGEQTSQQGQAGRPERPGTR